MDLALSGHVHAYERSCKVYKYKCQDDAPYYITIGDGGNKEGLASSWVEPQPEWSVFRQASYGFGKINVMNSTHVQWQWHQNGDLTPTIADNFYIVKEDNTYGEKFNGVRDLHEHVTGSPRFADSARGERGKKFNERALQEEKLQNGKH